MDVNSTGGSDGAEQVTSPAQGGSGSPQVSAPAAEPTIYDLSEDAMVRIGGPNAKPVKFGDYNRQFQSQFTRVSQAKAELEKRLQATEAEKQRIEQERARQSQGGGEPSILDKLAELPYLTGKEATDLVRQIGTEIQQRDVVMLQALKRMQQMEQTLSQLHNSSSTTAFEGKIDKFLSDGGYGKGWRNLAVETYLAYEPSQELDIEFPRILSERIAEVRKEIEAERAQAAGRARQNTFVPGRGGNASPSRPLQLDPKLSAREVADTLWEQLQNTGT